MDRLNKAKADLLYSAVDSSNGFYTCPVQPSSRSRMNVVFTIKGGDERLEKEFVKEAEARGMVGLAGHRSVGGLRASIYNATTIDQVQQLRDFMTEFQAREIRR